MALYFTAGITYACKRLKLSIFSYHLIISKIGAYPKNRPGSFLTVNAGTGNNHFWFAIYFNVKFSAGTASFS